jgi:hypothetical protein
MKTIELSNLSVTAHKPVLVTEGNVYRWFPALLERFSTGELFCVCAIMPDMVSPSCDCAIMFSRNEGETWSSAMRLIHSGGISVVNQDGSILSIPYYFYPSPPGQNSVFSTQHVVIRNGGKTFEYDPYGITIRGFPKPVPVSSTGAASLVFNGKSVRLPGNRLLTTIYGGFGGEMVDGNRSTLMAVASDDDGRNWKCLSIIAGPDSVPVATAAEGPCEACLLRLDNDDLLCVIRTGGVYRKSYSCDEGKTWSRLEAIEGVMSVEPRLLRLANGTIVLSGGRPGIALWFTTDGRGNSWQKLDIVGLHNGIAQEKLRYPVTDTLAADTTSYTDIVEISPNSLLLIYDQLCFNWSPVPRDSGKTNKVFAMRIDVRR